MPFLEHGRARPCRFNYTAEGGCATWELSLAEQFAANRIVARQVHDARQRTGLDVIARQVQAGVGYGPMGIDVQVTRTRGHLGAGARKVMKMVHTPKVLAAAAMASSFS